MKKRIAILLIATALPLSLYGCSKGDTEPVTSENVEVVETEEPTAEEPEAEPEVSEADTEESLSEGNEVSRDTGSGSEETTIDSSIVSNPNGGSDVAPPPEGGEDITPTTGETYVDGLGNNVEVVSEGKINKETNTIERPDGTYTVIGDLSDLSWRRMTDEEARAIVAKGDPHKKGDGNYTKEEIDQYNAAKGELEAAEGYAFDVPGAKLVFSNYYDYEAYLEEQAEKNRAENGEDIMAPAEWEEEFRNM